MRKKEQKEKPPKGLYQKDRRTILKLVPKLRKIKAGKPRKSSRD